MIDVQRCTKALQNVRIFGSPNTPARLEAIEEAIAAIGKDGATALHPQRIAIKNYAHFGDQRCDCRIGEGPKHGSIVFSIQRTAWGEGNTPPVLGDDEIYLLECVRDFGAWRDGEPSNNARDWATGKNLCDLLAEREKAAERLIKLNAHLKTAEVESNVAA